jgi:hypothetical protein
MKWTILTRTGKDKDNSLQKGIMTHHLHPNNKTKTRKSEEQATERTIPHKTDPKNTEDQPDTRQPEQA